MRNTSKATILLKDFFNGRFNIFKGALIDQIFECVG